MNRSQVIIIAIVLLILFGLSVRWQYGIYRTPLSVPAPTTIEEQMISGGPIRDSIPAIDKPVFETVAAADQYLDNDGFGLVVKSGSHVRFYPYQILVWHEIVNDQFDGKPLLVTYCPLTYTGLVFDPQINGEIFTFGTSGKLFNSNSVLQDRKTNSFWNQAMGEAMTGEMKGVKLVLRSSMTITWADFKLAFPNGMALSRRTGVTRDYTHDPYGSYQTNNAILFPVNRFDARLEVKTFISGYQTSDVQKAYPVDVIKKMTLVNDTVDTQSLVLFWDPILHTTRGYFRDPAGVPLTFIWQNDRLVDEQTHSVWNTEGQAVSGLMRGTTLTPIVLQHSFWFSWAAFYSKTLVYK